MESSCQTLRYLTIDAILRVAKRHVADNEVLKESQLRYLVEIVGQKFGDTELFPTLPLKAAVYAHHIIKDHPFFDGNKRTGMTCALWFLVLNGCSLRLGIDNWIFELGVKIANGIINDIEEIADHLQSWLEQQTREDDADGGI